MVQKSVIEYSITQYNTVQYNIVQYSTVQHNILQYSAVHYNTVQYSTVQYSGVQYSTVHSTQTVWSLHTMELPQSSESVTVRTLCTIQTTSVSLHVPHIVNNEWTGRGRL